MWSAEASTKIKKAKAFEIATNLRSEMSGKPQVVLLDEPGADMSEFRSVVGNTGKLPAKITQVEKLLESYLHSGRGGRHSLDVQGDNVQR